MRFHPILLIALSGAILLLATAAPSNAARGVAFGVWNKDYGTCHPSAVANKLDEYLWGEGDCVQVVNSLVDCQRRAGSLPGAGASADDDKVDNVLHDLFDTVQSTKGKQVLNKLWALLDKYRTKQAPRAGTARSYLAFGPRTMCVAFRHMDDDAWVQFLNVLDLLPYDTPQKITERYGAVWKSQLLLQLFRAQVRDDKKMQVRVRSLLSTCYPDVKPINIPATRGAGFIDLFLQSVYQGGRNGIITNQLMRAGIDADQAEEIVQSLAAPFAGC